MKVPIISRIQNFFEKRVNYSDLQEPRQWLLDALGIRKSLTGINITVEKAMQLSAVYSCVRIIAEDIASLPIFVYKRLKKGKEKAIDHPLFDILHNKPNEDMTSFSYRETIMTHLLLWGNSYSRIVKSKGGDILSLYPLLPSKMKVEIKDNKVVYTYDNEIISKEEILHIPGLSFNGIVGKSPIAYAREAIGLGLALEQFGAEYFSNSTNVGGVAQHPGKLGDKAYDNLKNSLSEGYTGLGSTHKLLILEEGMKFEKITIPPEDSQFIQSRKYQLEEIARIFRVPLHLLQNLDRGTFSNIEHQSIDYVVHTMRPWLVRIEQSKNIKLFKEEERKEYFAEHVVDGLLRGDIESRFRAYSTGIQNGIYSPNDVLELENRNPYEGGDKHFIQLNMQQVEKAGELPEGRIIEIKGDEVRILPKEIKAIPKVDREERQIRSANTRLRLAKSYRGLFENVVIRLVKRERTDILKIAKKAFGDRDSQLFNEKLDQYYQEHRDFIRTHTKPVFNTYAEAIAIEAADEVGYDGDTKLLRFMEEYQDAFGGKYTKENTARLKTVMDNAISKDINPIEALEKEFDHWEEEKPGSVSLKQTIKIASAASIAIYKVAGITKLVWRNMGSKTCAYCAALDGKVVGIEETFVPAGIEFSPEGADGSMKITGPKMHSPLHNGCVCMIMAEA